ncbi:hypothetical protein [Burkholderia sp. Ac-20365]|uniref:hypothetical protein n=1 Tax=Burkholderia sp. Ac-20365 TaxID=2703897 RepID=UPI00197C0762|nr:hypothetical protein [Burkholderia sp. Ac-20365]MBN3766271.1 hypothetical protein [Burkholderia sp. Ac-20365]
MFIAFSLESINGPKSAGFGVKRANRKNPSRIFSFDFARPGKLARAQGNRYRQGWTSSHDRSAK